MRIMKSAKQQLAIRTILLMTFSVISVLSLIGCSTSKDYTKLYPIKKGENIALQEPSYFVDSGGLCNLVPTNSSYAGDFQEDCKGIVAKGAKVKFLGIYAESSFMTDTHIRSYGRIVDGEFRNKKVNLDYVLMMQCKEDGEARRKISRDIFQITN